MTAKKATPAKRATAAAPELSDADRAAADALALMVEYMEGRGGHTFADAKRAQRHVTRYLAEQRRARRKLTRKVVTRKRKGDGA